MPDDQKHDDVYVMVSALHCASRRGRAVCMNGQRLLIIAPALEGRIHSKLRASFVHDSN